MLKMIFPFLKRRLLIFIFLALYFFFAFSTYKDYGMTMDEFFVYARGKYFYTKVRGNDPHLQKGFVVKETDNGNENLLFYNSSYAALLYALNNDGTYENYHLLNLLVASSIFCLFYEVLLSLYKKPYFAVIGPLFLFFTPRFLGHIPANPKDIPFAIFYFAGLMTIFFSRTWNEKVKILAIGLLVGMTAAIRFVGFSLLPIFFIYQIIIDFSQKKQEISRWLINVLLETFLIFLIAFLIFLVNMPYIAADPYNHLLELVKVNKEYSWNGDVLFFGKYYSTVDRPDSYLFLWITIATPFFILFLSAVSFFKKFSPEKNRLKYLLTLSLLFQIILYTAIHPVIYNAFRHYLFLLPQLILLAVMAFIESFKNKAARILTIVLVVSSLISLSKSYLELHPYEYSYFNAFMGGIKGASGRFSIDYWAASDKEALLWLKDYLENKNEQKTNVFTCSRSDSLNYYLKEAKNVNDNILKADYIVCYERGLAVMKNAPKIQLIHVVERQGVSLNYIYKVIRKN